MKYSIQSSIGWQIWAAEPRSSEKCATICSRNTRGCPAVTQIAGNKFVSGRSSLGSLPTVVAYAREFVKSGAHVWGGRTSPQIWVIFEWVLIGGVVPSKGLGETALRICLCASLTSAVCFVYELIIVILCQKCGCEWKTFLALEADFVLNWQQNIVLSLMLLFLYSKHRKYTLFNYYHIVWMFYLHSGV